jgi:adenylate cyclase
MRLIGPAFLAFLLVLASAYVRWQDSGVFRELDYATFDWRLRLRPPEAPGDQVAILVIDDATLQRLGHWPPPRAELAATLEALGEAGAAVVALDLLLLEEATPAGDADPGHTLVTALHRSPKPVLAMAFGFAEPAEITLADRLDLARNAIPIVRTAQGAVDLLGEPAGAYLPFAPLGEIAALGHVNVFVEPEGELRFLAPAIRFDGAWHPSLPVQAAIRLLDLPRDAIVLDVGRSLRLGDVTAPLDRQSRLVLDPYGPPGTFPQHSLIDLLDGRLDPALFAGRVVLVGATATGVRDRFGTAFHPQVPGVEIFANALDNLLTGRFIDRSTDVRHLDLALIALGTASGLLMLAPLPAPVLILIAGLLVALPFAIGAVALAFWGLWLNVVFATLGVIGTAGTALAWRAFRLYRRSRRSEARSRHLERYVPSMLRDRTAEGAALVERSQLAAILFCDLEGFTRAAETIDPDRLQPLLQSYYALVEKAASATSGVVAGFSGDGAMLIFGLPEPAPDDPARAIQCGKTLLQAIPAWQKEAEAAGLGGLRLHVGINYGRVRIGHVGGGDQVQLTANGDVVNVASRLQAMTRETNTDMLVAATAVETTRAQQGDAATEGLTPLPPLQLRGRATKVAVWAWSAG